MEKKKCYLYNFPSQSDFVRVREPSILYVVPNKNEWDCKFVFDNEVKKDGDLYLCSVFTCGYQDFIEFSKKIEKEKIIVGGYHPSLCPKEFIKYASKVVVGFGNNIDEIIKNKRKGIIRGRFVYNHMDRSVFPLDKLKEAWYADIFPGQRTFSINTFVGCPSPCGFADNCYIFSTYGSKKIFYPTKYLKEEIKLLNRYKYDNLFIRDEGFFLHPEFKKIVEIFSETGKRIYSSGEMVWMITEDLLRFLKHNNWFCLVFGIEVGRKKIENKELTRVIELAHKHKINVHLNIIIREKERAGMIKCFDNIKEVLFKHMPTSMETYFWTPYPGTKSFNKYKNIFTPNDYKFLYDEVPKFSDPHLVDWYIKKLFVVQLEYYQSKEYSQMRNFNCGDNLNLQVIEARKKLGLAKRKDRASFALNPSSKLCQ